MDDKVHGHQQTQFTGLYKDIEFIHNIRRKANIRKKMFERILIGS